MNPTRLGVPLAYAVGAAWWLALAPLLGRDLATSLVPVLAGISVWAWWSGPALGRAVLIVVSRRTP
ncbi:hypothetical protein M8C13_04345 [Crossiella sp. SN42]|uniref:hypothetical protein n=1 Tax=Crossiella sp. SN42 TaxID=2944808 RepID=UPI00207C197A|nr:hypothetical protein [Crossiella sp. SN42]MCO1574988.1 hypothetical protein [Crossiella sp. SN42]